MRLSDFRKLLAAFPDHEDAEVWVETGFGLSSPVTRIGQLNQCDVIIKTDAFIAPPQRQASNRHEQL